MKVDTNRGRVVVAGLAIVMMASACSSSVQTASETVDRQAEVVETDEALPESPTTMDSEPPDESGPTAESVFEPDAARTINWFSPIEPGTYRTDALGTPLSFTTTEALSTQVNGFGMFVLSDLGSQRPDESDLAFLRVSAFSDPASPGTSIEDQEGWPADDFLGWIDAVADGVNVSEPESTTVAGLNAIHVEITLDDVECGYIPGSCIGFVTNHDHELRALSPGASYRVWIVDQGEYEPLAIIAGIPSDDDVAWFDRADAVMETIAFGDPSPNLVTPVTGDEATVLDALGGVEVTFPDDRLFTEMWTDRRYYAIPFWDGPPMVVDIAEAPIGLDRTPLASADDAVAAIEAFGVEATELEPTTVDGVATRVFDLNASEPGVIVFENSELDFEEDRFGWDVPAAGRVWMIEHPERGLMIVGAKAYDQLETALPEITAWTKQMVDSIRFIDES